MDYKTVEAYLLSDGKMFALIRKGKNPVQLSLKSDPELSKVLRGKYDEVMPGHNLNKKYWNTLVLTGQLNWEDVQGLIRHSYTLAAES
jgi:predicted DNA-binding protein (MmcQ/YjbR family)